MDRGVSYIQEKITHTPMIGLILGSGLGSFADGLEKKIEIPYGEIPDFPTSSVVGHKGQLVFGQYKGIDLVCMQGRIHYYESGDMEKVIKPTQVLLDLGIETLIVTNAAGGVNINYNPGELMIIEDHINFSGTNPLIGPNDPEKGARFPDMSRCYDPTYQRICERIAEQAGIPYQRGVYMYFSGPSYETPSEVKMARLFGADAVGMSTVPEVIVANQRGAKVLGISCITNMAAGILDQPLNHEEVMEVSSQVQSHFVELLGKCIEEIGREYY